MKLQATAITFLLLLSTHSNCQTPATIDRPAGDSRATDAKSGANDSSYLRIIRNDRDEPIAMQTSVVTFRPKQASEVTVDLIGAVHVADASYFRQLNALFRQYDALLYELVAPEDHNVPTGGRSQHPVGQMQQGLKSMLDLDYQLEQIDYTKRNFVHADMSPEEFSRVMSERGESFLQMMMRMMGAALVLQRTNGGGSDADILFALFASDRSLRLKRIMSTQFGDLEGTMSVLEGEDGSTIIGQRNRKALEVLRRQLNKGKKRIGIFYGAGHLPDMEERLAEGFGFYPDEKSIKWLTAWDMKGK